MIDKLKQGAATALRRRVWMTIFSVISVLAMNATMALAQTHDTGGHGGEANLRLPDLSRVQSPLVGVTMRACVAPSPS